MGDWTNADIWLRAVDKVERHTAAAAAYGVVGNGTVGALITVEPFRSTQAPVGSCLLFGIDENEENNACMQQLAIEKQEKEQERYSFLTEQVRDISFLQY